MSNLLRGRWKKLDGKACASAITMYESGMSLAQIASHFGISRQSLWKTFHLRGVPMRSHLRYGTENHFYRGGSKAVDTSQNKLEKAVKRGVIQRPNTCVKC